MTPLEILSFLGALSLFGSLAGLTAGLFGVGGGVIIVPLLDSIFRSHGVPADSSIHMAIGTSLLTIIPTSLSSVRAHLRHHAIDSTVLKAWIVPIILGSILGGFAANHMAGSVLTLIFGMFVISIAALMALSPDASSNDKPITPGPLQKCLSFVIGFVSSLVGVGGGSMTVPVLTLYKVPIHRAIGTASAIGLLISLPASLVYLLSQNSALAATASFHTIGTVPGCIGNICLPAFGVLAPITALLATVGAKLSHRLNAKKLKQGFAVFLMVIAVKMIWGNFA